MIHSGKYKTEGGSNDGCITYYIYVLNEVNADVDTYAVTYTNDSKYGWEYSDITYVSPGSEHATDKLGILTTAATYGYLRDPDFVVFYLEPQTNGNYILYFNVCDPEFGWIGDGLQPGKKVQVSTENQTLSWSAEDNTLFEIGLQDDEFFSLTGNESYFQKITDGKATQSQLDHFVFTYF